MAFVGKFLASVTLICWLSSPRLLAIAAEVPVKTCPSENSVCNIGVRNGTGVMLVQQCECSDGRLCPSDIHKKDGTVFFEGKWLFTCSPIDTLPVCRPGQPSLRALSNGERDGGDLQVLCICSTLYNLRRATREIIGADAVVSFHCTGDQNSSENSHGEEEQISNEVLPVSDEHNLHLSSKDNKRSRGSSAFYKRGGSDSSLNAFYKRGLSGSSAFYKRDRNHLSSFYKRARFLKRAPFYKRKLVIAKRSADDSFGDDTPVERSSLSNIKDLDADLLSNFDKKGGGLNSFYKRGLVRGDSSFYKRGDFGTSSFYKRIPVDGSSLSSLDADESDNYLTPEEESAEAMSVESEATDIDPSPYYKRSLSNFYKRDPWSSKEETSPIEGKRALGEGNSAFYTRDDSSEETDTDKRARGQRLSSFYKRSRNHPSLSRFYKRYLSNRGDTYGISSFYKRGLGDVSNFYKRGYGDVSSFYKRGFGSVSSFYKIGVNNDSRFYKRGMNDDSGFYKRGLNDDSRFYKRGMNDDSRFYKRGLNDDLRFYKRGMDDDSRFYKRGLNDDSRFYKRGMNDDSRFYKKEFSDDSKFFKRGFGDASNFYKRSRGHSRFYKRDVGSVSSFYKRDPSSRFAFYKRDLNGASHFFKKGLDGAPSFYKRGVSGLSNFYKRGDKQYSFYKGNAMANPSLLTGGEAGSEQLQRLQKRSVSPNENKRQTDGRNESFYKRTYNDLTAFYKRSPSGNSMYSFYKRSPSDNSLYGFYKRSPLDYSMHSFYKRSPSDNSMYSFYKRGPSVDSRYSFYKRGSHDGSISNFYKRIPYDHSSNSFYKRTNDNNAFYKRVPGSSTMSSFYKRFHPDTNAFYKRFSGDLSSFYKRSPLNLQAFYKRALDDGISLGDLENFMEQRQENNYDKNSTSDHKEISSIDYVDDNSTSRQVGDSTQQNIKHSLL